MNSKVIIIGAGIGGLATGARLASRGYNVEIYEKEDTIGGKVNRFESGGFSFDSTASILMTPQVYKEVFTYANKSSENYLEFIKLDPNYRVFYHDQTTYDFSSDLTKLVPTLEEISIEDSASFIKLLAHSYEKYLIADRYFLSKPFTRFIDFFNPLTISKAIKANTLSTTFKYTKNFIDNEKLVKYICFQAMYVGISPYEGPNIYTLVPAVSQLYGLWYLKGGMYSYVKALEKIILEFGGKIHRNSPVKEILSLKDRAIGVSTDEGEVKGDIIICNADFSYSMKTLIKDNKAKAKYKDRRIENMKYSCGTFMIYLGLKKKYPTLSLHNLYLGEAFEKNIQAAFQGELPDKPSLYIYCPSTIDDSLCSGGKEVVNIMVRVPNLLFERVNWDSHGVNELRNIVINTVKKIKGLEDIEDNIEVEKYFTPLDMRNSYNSYGGASFGLSHTLTQTNYFRPSIKSQKIRNLYFVGDSVHPGTGVSIVLNSSKIVTEEILKNSPRNKL